MLSVALMRLAIHHLIIWVLLPLILTATIQVARLHRRTVLPTVLTHLVPATTAKVLVIWLRTARLRSPATSARVWVTSRRSVQTQQRILLRSPVTPVELSDILPRIAHVHRSDREVVSVVVNPDIKHENAPTTTSVSATCVRRVVTCRSSVRPRHRQHSPRWPREVSRVVVVAAEVVATVVEAVAAVATAAVEATVVEATVVEATVVAATVVAAEATVAEATVATTLAATPVAAAVLAATTLAMVRAAADVVAAATLRRRTRRAATHRRATGLLPLRATATLPTVSPIRRTVLAVATVLAVPLRPIRRRRPVAVPPRPPLVAVLPPRPPTVLADLPPTSGSESEPWDIYI